MLDTYGTRPLSWYASCAPDYLDTEEEGQDDRSDFTIIADDLEEFKHLFSRTGIELEIRQRIIELAEYIREAVA